MTNHRTGYLVGVAILGLLCACGGDDKSSTDASAEPTESSVTALTDEALVADMLRAVEGERGALPLLAFAAASLWDRRDREQGLLTRDAHDAIGDTRVLEAIARAYRVVQAPAGL